MSLVTDFTDKQVIQERFDNTLYKKFNVIDFSELNASAADVVQALKIGAGEYILKVYSRVITAEGATATATVGDGTQAAGWDASINLNASAGTLTYTLEATDTYGAGKYYAADDTIDLTLGHNMDTAVVEIWAIATKATKNVTSDL